MFIPYVNLPDKPLIWVTQSEAPSNQLVCVLICEKLKIHGESVCLSVNNDSFYFTEFHDSVVEIQHCNSRNLVKNSTCHQWQVKSENM